MKDLKVSNRYAKALLELAVETNNLEDCYSDMNTILTVCQESKEFHLLLKSPIIKTDKKIIIIEEVFWISYTIVEPIISIKIIFKCNPRTRIIYRFI